MSVHEWYLFTTNMLSHYIEIHGGLCEHFSSHVLSAEKHTSVSPVVGICSHIISVQYVYAKIKETKEDIYPPTVAEFTQK